MSDKRWSSDERSEDLKGWMRWLGTLDCPCPYEYKGLGMLYGTSMGKGWVRMDTDPVCPHHGSA